MPKTRSGKVMRRLLRDAVTTGRMTGDTICLVVRSLPFIAKTMTRKK
ncbi:hypothetical protein Q5761_09005 [Thermaerobacter composti]|uniref:Uncharacterized protein n=1 Tax=Thermaerobacter composti TaxID=554949 RepID=A0ABZ0QP03_9FIRM|nr:hypothetical protein [Thermaerobacter composti]WPD18497.1 hypothetical protein Q5761_09005 [Thermaerobacter composti]